MPPLLCSFRRFDLLRLQICLGWVGGGTRFGKTHGCFTCQIQDQVNQTQEYWNSKTVNSHPNTTSETTQQPAETAPPTPANTDSDYYEEGWAYFALNQTIRYRVPRAMIQEKQDSGTNSTAATTNTNTALLPDKLLIAAVLSTAQKRYDRYLVWISCVNKNRTSEADVYYFVSGDYALIKEEFEEQQDLIWIDGPDVYDNLLLKVKTMLVAIHIKAVPSYKFILKNDDDQYIRLWSIVNVIKRIKSRILRAKRNVDKSYNYFGECRGGGPVHRDPKTSGMCQKVTMPPKVFHYMLMEVVAML